MMNFAGYGAKGPHVQAGIMIKKNIKNDGFCIKNDGFCIEMQSCTSDPSHHVIYRDCTDRMRVNSSFYINYI